MIRRATQQTARIEAARAPVSLGDLLDTPTAIDAVMAAPPMPGSSDHTTTYSPDVRRLIDYANVPAKYQVATLHDVSQIPLEVADKYHTAACKLGKLLGPSAGGRIVILSGPVGTGKTWLACALVMEIARRPDRAIYRDTRQFVEDARRAGYDGKPAWSATLERFLRARLVVFDEALSAIDTQFAQSKVEQVVDSRYAAGRDTILIGNANPETLRQVLGERIWDRAQEDGGVIEMNWPSLRGRLKQPEGK